MKWIKFSEKKPLKKDRYLISFRKNEWQSARWDGRYWIDGYTKGYANIIRNPEFWAKPKLSIYDQDNCDHDYGTYVLKTKSIIKCMKCGKKI